MSDATPPLAPGAAPAWRSGDARILEAGYRRYDGPRLGPEHAVWTLARHSFERIMGLKRPARYKVLGFSAVIVAYLPAIAFVGIAALVPASNSRRLNFIPPPGRYYGFITAAIVLFSVLAAPEAICPDRRSGFLGIYLASPLTRASYLLSKALAVAAALLLVTIGPPLLLLFGLALQNMGPPSALDFFATLGQIVAAGLCLSAMYCAIALAIPTFTDRRAFASAGALLLIVGSGAVARTLSVGLNGSYLWQLLSLDRLPFELATRIFTLPQPPGVDTPPLPTADVIAVSIAVTLAAAAIAWWRIVGTEVRR